MIALLEFVADVIEFTFSLALYVAAVAGAAVLVGVAIEIWRYM